MNSNELSNTGKRMPYRVPDGFFDSFEDKIMTRVAAEPAAAPKRRRGLIMALRFGAVAAAAALALVLLPDTSKPQVQTPAPVQFAEVEHAFDQLSDNDQTYLVDNYDQDLMAAYQQQYTPDIYAEYTEYLDNEQ